MNKDYKEALINDLYDLELRCNITIEDLAEDICSDIEEFSRQERADAIDEAIKWAKKNYNISSHYKHNFSSERVIETTVNYDELIAKLEQIKEHEND